MAMEAKTRLQPSKKTFAKDMKSYFPTMRADERDALITKLYRLATFKRFLDWYAATKRTEIQRDTPRFREYRIWLVDVEEKLSKAMKAMHQTADAANRYPRQNYHEEIEKLIVGKTFNAIARAGQELQRAIDLLRHMQHSLAAGIHPKKRTGAEKRLVPEEPIGLQHTDLPLGEKTPKIDLWFIGQVAHILDKYRTSDGKPVRNYQQIIEGIFDSAFGVKKTPGSIQKELSPSRLQKRPPLF
jgi:hypothetical protein